MCGFPDGWISPRARSITFGISSLTTYCDASRYPGDPGWMRSLPDCVSSNGSQPTSSSEPEHTTRSALRMRAIKLGRASIRCGSCRAVVAEKTETLSPPSSCASAPHSGSQAKTFSAAPAGHASMAVPNARSNLRRFFMCIALEPVRAMRAEAHDVLEKELVVGLVEPRVVARELQPDAAELARIPVHHHRVALRVVAAEDREIRRAQRTGIHQPDIGRARIKPVVAVAEAPLRQELVHALQIPSRLAAVEPIGQRRARGVEREITVLVASEVFALQLEVVVGRVAVRRPLQNAIEHPEPAFAGKAVGDRGAGGIDIIVGPVLRRSPQVRKTGLPGDALPEVSSEMREEVRRAEAVLVELVAEERLHGEGRVGEVPGVRVDLVLVSHRGEEPPSLDGEAVRQADGLDVPLLDVDAAVVGR